MKELKGVDENTVIHCATREEWDHVREILASAGKIWANSTVPVNKEYSDKDHFIEEPILQVTDRIVWHGSYSWFTISEPKLMLKATEFIRLNTEPETPAIPDRWCVRRTPENAGLLNAYFKFKWPHSSSLPDITSEIYFDKNFRFGYYKDLALELDLPEITTEQWQTIPEVAEWFWNREISLNPEETPEKVEEREIIGYEAPFDMDAWKIKSGTEFNLFDKGLYRSEGIGIQVFLPSEWVETWKPVYREIEKPVFKVGDWVTFEDLPTKKTFNIDEIDQITEFDRTQRVISAGINYSAKCCRLATPEEIEAARPKEIWEKYPTWESLGAQKGWNTVSGSINEQVNESDKDDFATIKHAESALSFAQLSQLEKAWNQGKQGNWTVKYDAGVGRMVVLEMEKYPAQINFTSEILAKKSMELHSDLWVKYWMV